MPEPSAFTFTGRVRSFRCAARGIGIMLRSQHNAWLHAAASALALGLGVACKLTSGEWCAVLLAVIAVWTAEALNTALELLTDIASPSFHPLAGKAKDVAAGAVLITSIGAVIIGLLVFGPRAASWM